MLYRPGSHLNMTNIPPYIEVLQGHPYPGDFYPESGKSTSWLNRRRFFVFLSVFILGCLVCLPYNFMRSPLYESRGTLLFVLPKRDTETDEKMDTQHIAMQRQILISNPMLTKILGYLEERNDLLSENFPIALSDLKSMLNVMPTENMNVVKVSANGQRRQLLPILVNTWMDVYLENLADLEESSFKATNTELYQQSKELQRTVAEKRQELERFRKEHDIVSTEREENWDLTSFNGLTDTLKKAKEELAAATARLNAIRDAVKQGKPFVRAQDQEVLTNLENRVADVQVQLKELEMKYTREYMKIDKQSKTVIGKLKLLTEEINLKRRESQQLALAEAEQTQAAVQFAVDDLQQQLTAHKKTAADYSEHFSKHEALKEQLTQLERLYNDVSKQLVKMEVTNKQQLPQIQVLERALLPEHPVRPYYLRDAGISVAGSFVLGLLAVWFYEFLAKPTKLPAGAQRQPLFYVVSDPQKTQQPAIRDVRAEQPLLEQRLPRELSVSEVKTLTDSANDPTRLLIDTILSGLSIEEAAALRSRHINLQTGIIHVQGESERTIPLSAKLKAAFSHHDSATDESVWHDTNNNPLTVSDLTELISRAAHNSKLCNPSEINEQAIRHTYFAFLIRQGARMEDIERITGRLSRASIALYNIISPPGTGLPLDRIDTVYPTLQNTF